MEPRNQATSPWARHLWRSSIAAGWILALSEALGAGDVYVDQSDPDCLAGTGGSLDPLCTISAAIAMANPGDTIHIAPGLYSEALSVGMDLTLRGTNGQSVTIVQSSMPGSVLHATSFIDLTVDGLTFLNANTGVAVDMGLARSLTISNSTVTSDQLGVWGTGLQGFQSTLTMTNCTVSHHSQGSLYYVYPAGIFWDGVATIIDSQITDNFGTGFRSGFDSDVTITNSTIRNNAFGVDLRRGNLTMVDCSISGATGSYGGSGSGIRIREDAIALLTNCTVSGNTAEVYGRAAGVYNESVLVMDRCLVSNNYGYGNGAIENRGDLTMTHCAVVDNLSPRVPGIDNYGTVTLSNCTIAGNMSDCEYPQYDSFGALTNRLGATTVLDHSIIGLNRGPCGINCSGVMQVEGSNLIYGGCTVTGDLTGLQTGVDPLFTDTASGDYTLQVNSPAIDAGNLARLPCDRDLGGNPRINDGNLDGQVVIDLGAHEFSHAGLQIGGTLTPGGELLFDFPGTPGMLLLVWIGTDLGSAPAGKYGCLLVDPGLGSFVVANLGMTPLPQISVDIDPLIPPVTLTFQSLALVPGAGNFSNPVVVSIE